MYLLTAGKDLQTLDKTQLLAPKALWDVLIGPWFNPLRSLVTSLETQALPMKGPDLARRATLLCLL